MDLFSGKKSCYLEVSGKTPKGLRSVSLGHSGGDLRKWICSIDGSVYYIKASSENGYESEVEVLVSQIGTLLGLPVLEYSLDTLHIDGKFFRVCVSRDYTESAVESFNLVELIPHIAEFTGFEKYKKCLDSVRAKDKVYQFSCIFLIDYICNNPDRHLRNIEILIDNKGDEIFSQIFDNGAGLFSTTPDTILKFTTKTKTNGNGCKPFLGSQSAQLELVDFTLLHLNQIEKAVLYRLVNNMFKHERAKYINKWLVDRLLEFDLLK